MTSNRAFARPDNLAADHQTGGDGIPFDPGGVTANNVNVNDGGRPSTAGGLTRGSIYVAGRRLVMGCMATW
jgi:hypothetical protein